MNKMSAAMVMVATTAGWLGLAGVAAAAPSGSSAQDTVEQLRSEGHNVEITNATGPLERCTVDRVRGLGESAPGDATAGPDHTVFVDVSCPGSADYGP